jgi:hypothetical protein
MRQVTGLLLVLHSLLLGLVAPAWTAERKVIKDPVQAKQIARMIEQLGSPKYAARQAADRALDQQAAAALPALSRAVKSTDPEVRWHARDLIAKIGRRIERDKLLAATRLHLVYKDTPVADAVADLAKKSGFVIQIEGDKSKLVGRKITLDTGETTFWQAFDQFCARAELSERGLMLAHKVNPRNRIISRYQYQKTRPKADPRLFVLDAKPSALPTAYFHGLRVRALPPTVPLRDLTTTNGEKVLVLEAALEPRTRLHDLHGLRINRATGEHGRAVAFALMLLRDPLDSAFAYNPYGRAVPLYVQQLEHGMDEGNFRRILLRIKGATCLKELQGVLLVEVDKPSETLFTVENILKAVNKSFNTTDGGSVTLIDARRQTNGDVHLQIRTVYPLQGFNGIRIMNGFVQVRRQIGGAWEALGLKPEQLKLQDARGRAFRLARVSSRGFTFAPGGMTQRLTLVYQPANDAAGASKLVYFGAGTTVLEVPFTLTNVPLPK